jgi:ABC-2 type transport system ATP-binding protein
MSRLSASTPTRKSLVAFLHDLALTDGIAVLWGTHLADEAAQGDDAVILSRGEVKASGRVADIIEANGQTSLDAAFTALTGEPVAA